jgi:serine/threonine protein kinase
VNAETWLVAGRYRLDQQIGTGAMGVVWRAHDERLDRTVALKELLMQPGLAESDAETARARAMREGRIAARLQHPHAICVYDVALDRGTSTSGEMVPWLVMEYLPSRSLATVLAEQGPLPPEEVARIGWQAAAALAAAHQAGIVHRDIKPGNVLLGEDGIVKITDFGISRASWDTTVTRTGVLAGTPAYFAPEVARGEEPGPASDVFSLGSMLYVAVEGEPPFGLDDNTLALLRTVAEGHVRPSRRAGPLSVILRQLLADDPAARPSMPDVVTALGAVAAHGETPAAAPPLFGSPTTRPPRPSAATPAHPPPTAVGLSLSSPPHRRAAPVLWWQRPAALLSAAACLVVLAIVLGTLGNTARLTAAKSATPSARTVPAPQQPQQPQPAQLPQQAQPAQISAQLEQTVRAYYGLLPEDSAVAWQYLGPAEHAQGFAHYTKFWNSINRISIRGPVAVQGNTVLVNLLFEPTNRKPTVERYRLNMTTSPIGRVIIESASRIAS